MSVSAPGRTSMSWDGDMSDRDEKQNSIYIYIYAVKAAQIVSLVTALEIITLLYVITLKILLTAYQSTRS